MEPVAAGLSFAGPTFAACAIKGRDAGVVKLGRTIERSRQMISASRTERFCRKKI